MNKRIFSILLACFALLICAAAVEAGENPSQPDQFGPRFSHGPDNEFRPMNGRDFNAQGDLNFLNMNPRDLNFERARDINFPKDMNFEKPKDTNFMNKPMHRRVMDNNFLNDGNYPAPIFGEPFDTDKNVLKEKLSLDENSTASEIKTALDAWIESNKEILSAIKSMWFRAPESN